MNLIQQSFQKRAAFVGYLTAGDGGMDYSVEASSALIEGGVDLLELGVPFSDPIADGLTIQKACERALREKMNLDLVFEMAARIKKVAPSHPLVLFSYFNPVLQMGTRFSRAASSAGFDGILLLDLPFDHSFYEGVSNELQPIFVATPSTSVTRLESIVKKSEGFIYYACQKGTTGIRSALPPDLKSGVRRIKEQSSVPVAVGFGISTVQNALEVLKSADGFVVGSAFVKLIEERCSPDQLMKFARSIDPRVRRHD